MIQGQNKSVWVLHSPQRRIIGGGEGGMGMLEHPLSQKMHPSLAEAPQNLQVYTKIFHILSLRKISKKHVIFNQQASKQ